MFPPTSLNNFTLQLSRKPTDPLFSLSVCPKKLDHDTFAKLHVFTNLTDAQTLDFDHLHYLELETCVKVSSRFLVIHFCCHQGQKNLSLCLFKLDHYTSIQAFSWMGSSKIRTPSSRSTDRMVDLTCRHKSLDV